MVTHTLRPLIFISSVFITAALITPSAMAQMQNTQSSGATPQQTVSSARAITTPNPQQTTTGNATTNQQQTTTGNVTTSTTPQQQATTGPGTTQQQTTTGTSTTVPLPGTTVTTTPVMPIVDNELNDFNIGADANIFKTFVYQTQGENYTAEITGYTYTYHRTVPAPKMVNWTINNDIAQMKAAAGIPFQPYNPIRVDDATSASINDKSYSAVTRTINNKDVRIFVRAVGMQVYVVHVIVTSEFPAIRQEQLNKLSDQVSALCPQC